MEKKALLLLNLMVLMLIALPSAAFGRAYFVDATVGADENAGTRGAPWRSVARVNDASLKPGDAVYFKCGERWDSLLRPLSGSNRLPITYGGYGRGGKPSIGGAYLKGQSHIHLRDVELRSSNDRYPLHLDNSHHVTVTNCKITADSSSKAYAALYVTFSHHNRVARCTIERRNTRSQGDAVYLNQNADFNLFEDNDIGMATHYSLFLLGATASNPDGSANYNIIRDNRIFNTEGAAVSVVSNADHNLIEDNDIRGGKSTGFNSNAASSFQLLTKNNIVRRNIIRDNASRNGYGLQMIAYRYHNDPPNQIMNNYIYNNVITNIYRFPVILGNYEPRLCQVKNNKLANNVVCGNGSSHQIVVERGDNIAANAFRNNIICEGEGKKNVLVRGRPYALPETELGVLDVWRENLSSDPKLDARFRPAPGSPAVDAGTFLTGVTSASGFGRSLVVEDAGWFCDGFGISPGDTIVIGASTAVIAKIDYGSNTITLKRAVSWKSGDRVSLPYRGTRPDIGVFEYAPG